MQAPACRGPQAKIIRLTAGQRRELHSVTRSGTFSQRIQRRALALLALARGERVSHVARMLDVSQQSVIRWRDAWEMSKKIGSLTDQHRSGRPREWTEEREELLTALLERSPSQFGYRAMCWTSHLLSNQLERVSGWKPSDRSMRLALKEFGYVYKRPRYVLEPDPQFAKKSP